MGLGKEERKHFIGKCDQGVESVDKNKESEDKISNIIISPELITSWSKNLFKMLRILARGNRQTVRLGSSVRTTSPAHHHDIWPDFSWYLNLWDGKVSGVECSYLSFEFQIWLSDVRCRQGRARQGGLCCGLLRRSPALPLQTRDDTCVVCGCQARHVICKHLYFTNFTLY